MNRIIAWFVHNPVASNLLMLVMVVGGLMILASIRQEEFPAIEPGAVQITVEYKGASPAEVEQSMHDGVGIVEEVLHSGNYEACKNTRDVLGRLGPAVIPFLLEALAGENDDARFYSITVLGELAPDSAAAVPLLTRTLTSGLRLPRT